MVETAALKNAGLSPPPFPQRRECRESTAAAAAWLTQCTRFFMFLFLPVGLGDALNLVLLLDGVAVGRSLGGVDDLISEALGDSLWVPESGRASSDDKEVDALVDAAKWGDVDGLAPDDTGRSDPRGILPWSGVYDGVDEDLDGVLISEQVDDLERGLEHADGQELLSRVAPVEHEGTDDALDDGAVCLLEPLLGIPSSRVRQVHVLLGGDVILQRKIHDLDICVAPLVEQLDLRCKFSHLCLCFCSFFLSFFLSFFPWLVCCLVAWLVAMYLMLGCDVLLHPSLPHTLTVVVVVVVSRPPVVNE